jgi:hypothetical protein
MKEIKIAAIATIGIVLSISLVQSSSMNNSNVIWGVGFSTLLLSIVAIIVGIILSLIPASRKYRQGILIGGGILLLIGIGCCTGGFGLFL